MADIDSPIEAATRTASEQPKARGRGRLALMLSVPLLLLTAAGLYWLSLQGKVSTDNAYVQQDMVTVSGEVGGQIVEIFVREGEQVAAGQLLFRIDPEPYRIAQADRLQVGQQLVANLPVLTLVMSDASYVEANFKETDLTHMQIGQRAQIELDAWPDLELVGRVASIGAGTGAEFSVLPAQNATGNWVKVTQRVPVRIVIEGKPDRPLIAGLSAEVTVLTGKRSD